MQNALKFRGRALLFGKLNNIRVNRSIICVLIYIYIYINDMYINNMYISEAGRLQLNRLHNCSRLSRGCLEQGVQADLLLGKPEGGLAKAAGGAQQQHAQQLQQGLAELKLQADLLMAELKEAWQRQLGKGSSAKAAQEPQQHAHSASAGGSAASPIRFGAIAGMARSLADRGTSAGAFRWILRNGSSIHKVRALSR